MEWLTDRADAVAYPDGLRIRSKTDGREGVIERQCYCGNGNWLHYEVRMLNDKFKHPSVYQHPQIERLFEILV